MLASQTVPHSTHPSSILAPTLLPRLYPLAHISSGALIFTKLGDSIGTNWTLSSSAWYLEMSSNPRRVSFSEIYYRFKLTIARFDALTVVDDDGIWRNIAVPSRLYSKYSPDRPLAGARLSLKDIFRLKGVKTTMMSRAFTALHEPELENADYVTKLLGLGAVIVGKTKMTQFASSDEPTDQWIDFHCPFNPRGDMYQSPSGSSSGAAAGLAGYKWLDYAIAGDCMFRAVPCGICEVLISSSCRKCPGSGYL